MNNALKRSIVVVVILGLAVLCGYICQVIDDRMDAKNYPREYAEFVSKYAEAYGVPEQYVYAVIKVASDFASNKVSETGAVGLMQMTPNTFQDVAVLMKRTVDSGMLYNPETNIEFGTYLLSYLYMRYPDWDTAFMFYSMEMTGEANWIRSLPDEKSVVASASAKAFVRDVREAAGVYVRLYYKSY